MDAKEGIGTLEIPIPIADLHASIEHNANKRQWDIERRAVAPSSLQRLGIDEISAVLPS